MISLNGIQLGSMNTSHQKHTWAWLRWNVHLKLIVNSDGGVYFGATQRRVSVQKLDTLEYTSNSIIIISLDLQQVFRL
jgi:hypothetical protein